MKQHLLIYLCFYFLLPSSAANAQTTAGCSQWIDLYTTGTVTNLNTFPGTTWQVIVYPWDTVTLIGSWSSGCAAPIIGTLIGPGPAVSTSCNSSPPCVFPITQTGTYQFIAEYPIMEVFNIYFWQPTGIDETNSNLLQVYPNPAKEELNVKSTLQNFELRILDMQGRLMRTNCTESGMQSFDISGLAPGNYNLILKSEGQLFSKRFIKM